MARVLAWVWNRDMGRRWRLQPLEWPKVRALSPQGHEARWPTHTYAFVVVVVLGTQAGWGLGRRPEKPGGGLLTGGTRPGGGGGGAPFRSTTVLKPVEDGGAHRKISGRDPRWPGRQALVPHFP